MASNINEITVPVVNKLRNLSSGVSTPVLQNNSNALQERNGAGKPSQGSGRVDAVNENERLSSEEIERMLQEKNDLARHLNRKLIFSYDDRIGKVIVKVTEGDSEEVIRQIPPEEMIRLALKIEGMMGMLFNQSI